jgi:hypothetical protein
MLCSWCFWKRGLELALMREPHGLAAGSVEKFTETKVAAHATIKT